jgi:anti-sigma factor RsiW
MTEEKLMRWVRGELSGADRREVSRWLVRCTDPRLGPLLAGMVQEARDEAADRALAARGGAWPRLIEAWSQLLELGRAGLSGGLEGGLVLATDGQQEAPLSLQPDGDQVAAVVVVPEGAEAALFLTADDGSVEQIWGPTTPTGRVTIPLPTAPGERATIWLLWGSWIPSAAPIDTLLRALDREDTEARAIRLVPEEV